MSVSVAFRYNPEIKAYEYLIYKDDQPVTMISREEAITLKQFLDTALKYE